MLLVSFCCISETVSNDQSLLLDLWQQGFALTIGVGAIKFLGVQRIFTQIFPNLPKKFLCNFCRPFFSVTFQKMVFTCFPANVGRQFFEVKQRWAPFLPKFLVFFLDILGVLFGFSGILPKFSENQNFWGCTCTPCTPASYTTNTDYLQLRLQLLQKIESLQSRRCPAFVRCQFSEAAAFAFQTFSEVRCIGVGAG